MIQTRRKLNTIKNLRLITTAPNGDGILPVRHQRIVDPLPDHWAKKLTKYASWPSELFFFFSFSKQKFNQTIIQPSPWAS